MKSNIIYETKYWTIILTDNQYELGRCVIDIKRDVGEMGKLNTEEWNDLHENVVIKLENALKKIFGTKMFNWSCLMNNAFKPHIEKPHPHIHLHFRPRYRNPVEFMGETFIDEEFGHHYDRQKDKRVSQEVFDGIRKEIKAEIDKQ